MNVQQRNKLFVMFGVDVDVNKLFRLAVGPTMLSINEWLAGYTAYTTQWRFSCVTTQTAYATRHFNRG